MRGGNTRASPLGNATPSLSASACSHPRVLERPPSWLMEPLDHDASPRGHHSCSCVIHGWGPCPNSIAPSSQGHEVEEEREEDEEEPREILVVSWLLQRSLTHRTVRKTISPRGQPQGTLAPRTYTPLASPIPSLVVPLALMPPPSEANPH
jgi:hypothetical protein